MIWGPYPPWICQRWGTVIVIGAGARGPKGCRDLLGQGKLGRARDTRQRFIIYVGTGRASFSWGVDKARTIRHLRALLVQRWQMAGRACGDERHAIRLERHFRTHLS